jgi:flagellar biosynthesis/type III secretory pathway protein FliH
VYSVSILYFELGQGEDYLYYGRTDFRGVFKKDLLKLSAGQAEQFQCSEAGDLYPEYYILRVEDFDREAVTPLDEWFSFLKTGEIPEGATAPGLQEASRRLCYDRMSKEEQQEYDDYTEAIRYRKSVIQTSLFEGRAEGLAEGEAIGSEKGKAEGKAERDRLKAEKEAALAEKEADRINVVINSSDAGIPVKTTAKITGLTVEEVMKILNKRQPD